MTSRKFQVVEYKDLNLDTAEESRENAGGKYEGSFRDVVENKWWKNVRIRALHDVDENKQDRGFSPRC